MAATRYPEWKQLVAEHSERVFRSALRILGSVHDAEDVAQEVFTEAYQLKFPHHVQCWQALLVHMATCRSIDLLRRRKTASPVLEHDRVSTAQPGEALALEELVQHLRAAIAQLSDQQATVFTLMHFEQLSREDVAEMLGISVEAVSTAMYKARQRLRIQLEPFLTGERHE